MPTSNLPNVNSTDAQLPQGLEPQLTIKPASVRPSEVVIILLIVLLCLCMLGTVIVVLTLMGNIPDFLRNIFSAIPAAVG